ncbi:hypothetical protein D3C71_234980 [compost metagenome]
MAFNAGVIQASLNMVTTGFTRALSGAVSSLRTAGQQMNNAFGPGAQGNINNTANAANRLANSFKDVNRIVSGIVIAQVFYQGVQAIESGVSSLVEFSNQMQVAQVSMEYFLGTADKASGFVAVMQDFAATTPFSTAQSIDLSRKLMAMGFQSKSILNVMQTLVDATAAAGGTGDELNRIVIALGQINTQGYLAGQELRQLANANIPIYKILQEQLGLTGDQMKEIGKLKIPADIGIAAILQGLQKYQGAAKRLSEETLTGMWANIKDNMSIIGEQAFKKPYDALNGFVRKIYETLETARDVITKRGLGGLFEHFVPPTLQPALRSIAGGVMSLGQSLSMLYGAFKPVIATVGGTFIKAFGVAIPLIANFVRQIAVVTSEVMRASPFIRFLASSLLTLLVANTAAKALMFLWNVTRLGSLCAFVATSVTTLSRAIAALTLVISKNKIIMLITVVAAALIGLAMSSKTASAWLDGVMSRLNKLVGMDTSGILTPSDGKDIDKTKQEYNDFFDNIDKNLSGVGEGLEDTGKAADKAGKAVDDKFVASFDELYQIPDKLDDVAGGLGDIGSLPTPNFDFDAGDVSIPDVTPDLGGGGDDTQMPPYLRNLKKWFTDFEWPSLPSFPVVSFEIPLNAIKGFLADAQQGVINFGNAFANALANAAASASAFAAGALTGFNTALGVAADFVNGLAGALNGLGTAIGNAGIAVGDFAKNTGAFFSQLYVDVIGSVTGWTNILVDLIGTATAIAATRIADFVGDLSAKFDQLKVDIIEDVTAWTKVLVDKIGETTLSTGLTIATWAATAAAAFETWRTKVETSFSNWRTNVKTTVTNWATDVGTAFATWSTSTSTAVSTWAATVGTMFATWRTNVNTTVSNWAADFGTTLGKWKTNTTTVFTSWKTSVETLFTSWSTAVATSLSNWANTTANNVTTWANNVGTVFSDTFSKSNKLFGEFISATGTSWANFLNNTSTWTATWGVSVGTVFAEVANSASKSMNILGNNSWDALKGFFAGAADGVTEWARGFVRTIADGARAAWSWLKNLATAAGATLGGFSDSIDDSIKSATVSMGAWYDRNKSWAVPAAITVGVVGGAIALAPFTGGWSLAGLAALETGGIVDQDQLIRIGEGNKREAVIPLENSAYMKPFSKAVANDLAAMMGEQVTYSGGNSGADARPIMYVHTLVADDRALKELERKLEVIRVQENERKGRG